MVGHGSLNPLALSPMETYGFAYTPVILVMTSEHYPHSKVCVWGDKQYL